MKVERVKYLIWAADHSRAIRFYQQVFGAELVRQNPHVAELNVQGSTLGIHSGGSGEKTWTGLAFQVADVIEGAAEILAAGGSLTREPEPEDNEPPHLAMCVDPEGNEIMLFRQR